MKIQIRRPWWLRPFIGDVEVALTPNGVVLANGQATDATMTFVVTNTLPGTARIDLLTADGVACKIGFLDRREATQALQSLNSPRHAARIKELSNRTLALFDSRHFVSASELNAIYQKTVRPGDSALTECKAPIHPRLDKSRKLARLLVHEAEGTRSLHNDAFILQQLEIHRAWFDCVETNPLTDRQREAAIRNEDSNLVVAGAGTGKTSCVVARVGYLLRQKLARPDDILILAYGKKAQVELAERIAKQLDNVQVEIRTFHSLGLSICAQRPEGKPSLSRLAEDEKAMLNFVEATIAEGLHDKTCRAAIMDFLAYYRNETIDEWDFDSMVDYFRRLGQIDLRTLEGVKVKSQQELKIANWLTLHGIEYEYEKKYSVDTADQQYSQYKPDFYLPTHDLYLEHFGIDLDGNTAPFIDKEKYWKGIRWKRDLHKQHQTDLIETYSYQHRRGTWRTDLQSVLEEKGVEISAVSVEHVLAILRETGQHHTLSKFFGRYISLLKSTDVSIQELKSRAIESTRHSQKRVDAFLKTLTFIYDKYQSHLSNHGEIDFGDMIRMANEAVSSGNYHSPFTHIIVDEFQDISRSRANLLLALKNVSESVRLFCVGDDWQSIYRFAGSDVKIMAQFQENFGYCARTDLDQTFRYPDKLLAAATRFVTANPLQLRKDMRSEIKSHGKPIDIRFLDGISDDDSVATSLDNTLLSIREEIETEVRSKRTTFSESGKASILFLARYNFVEKELPIGILNPDTYVEPSFKTVHRAKGLEADYVVILNVVRGRYGFPSGIDDDPLFGLILGEADAFQDAEERRLLYVALTRARQKVYLLTEHFRRSTFVEELLKPEYHDEVIAAESIFTEAHCPECDSLVARKIGAYGNFWSCESWPICEGKLTLCKKCRIGAIVKKERMGCCNYQKCEAEYQPCPGRACDGLLIHREGPFGPFFGCSNWKGKGIGCQVTRNR